MSRATISPPCRDCGRRRYPHAPTCSRTRPASLLATRVLACVEREPGATPDDVADELGIEAQRAEMLLHRLYRDGHLTRAGYSRRVGVVFAYRVAA